MAYGKTSFNGSFPRGFLGVIQGDWLNFAFEKVLQGGVSRKNALTATPGGAKAGALPLVATYNRFNTVASANDSCLLPKAIAGSEVTVINSGAQTLGVYGKGTDTIDGVSTATANTIATTKAKKYTCISNGFWHTTSAT